MKQYFAFPLFALVLFSLFFSSCKKPLEDVEISVSPDVMKYTALLQVYDAADGSAPTGVTITFTGANAKDIYDLSGKKVFTPEKGFLPIGLAPSRKPVGSAAITVNALITAPGHLPVNKIISFKEGKFDQVLAVPLVNLSKLPEGVSAFSGTYTLANNTLSSSLMFQTPLTNEKQEQATVEIPAGTVFRDKNGNPISGTSFKVQAVHFDTRSAVSFNAFPGGFTPDAVKLQDGSQAPVTFLSAGFASINFTVGSTEVKQFDRPVKVAISANPDLVNPETNQKVKAGDAIPVWSYNVEEGIWKFESTGVFKSVNGKLVVDFTTTHLTWFNLDWYRDASCSTSPTFTVGGAGDTKELYLVQFYTPYNPNPIINEYIMAKKGDTLDFQRAPNLDVKLKIMRLSSTPGVPTETPWLNLCSAGGPVDFPVDDRTKVSIEVVGVCTARGVEVRPSGYVWYRDVTPNTPPSYYRPTWVEKGMLETKDLQVGHTYAVEAKWGNTKFAFTKKLESDRVSERVTLNGSLCNGF